MAVLSRNAIQFSISAQCAHNSFLPSPATPLSTHTLHTPWYHTSGITGSCM